MIVGNQSDPCKLCEGPGPLRKSHILPEFLYKSLYDNKHRYVGVPPDPDSKISYLQQGLREYMLCSNCEERLSAWEAYAASVLRNIPDTTRASPGAIFEIPDVDYRRFKLFQLSLLWRVGASKHATFSGADLGPHLERIQQLIIAGDPAERATYGCVLSAFRGGKVDTIGRPPRPVRTQEGHRSVLFMIAGLIWVFVVSSHSKSMNGQASFLGEDGVLRIHIGSRTPQQFIAGVAASLKKMGLL